MTERKEAEARAREGEERRAFLLELGDRLRPLKDASEINSVFALVLGLLAFFYLTAVTVVLCAEVNVVRAERLYPRALLTPFTDNVELTGGDHRAYTGQAVSQRSKGFEKIHVSFEKPAAEDEADA